MDDMLIYFSAFLFCMQGNYTDEQFRSVQYILEFRKLEGISHHVSSCEVLVKEKRVKLVGTPEGCEQAEKEIKSVLVG